MTLLIILVFLFNDYENHLFYSRINYNEESKTANDLVAIRTSDSMIAIFHWNHEKKRAYLAEVYLIDQKYCNPKKCSWLSTATGKEFVYFKKGNRKNQFIVFRYGDDDGWLYSRDIYQRYLINKIEEL